jgi:hypothetical protein
MKNREPSALLLSCNGDLPHNHCIRPAQLGSDPSELTARRRLRNPMPTDALGAFGTWA